MDYTGMSLVLTCPRESQYAVTERLAAPETSASLEFGAAWHRIMDAYNTYGWELSGDFVDELVTTAVGEYREKLGDYRTVEKLKRGFRAWLTQYAATHWIVRGSEASFTMEIVPGAEPYEGRIDALVEACEGDKPPELWVVDYKTTGRLEADWVTQYRVSNQFKGYFVAAKSKYPQAAGVIVDVYHATKGVQKGKTAQEVGGDRFYRVFFRFEEFQLNEFKADYGMALINRETYRSMGYWPKNTRACTRFGRSCDFLELCDASSKELRETLKGGFVENTHSPQGGAEL